jgi:hypothetical protein
MSKKDMQNQVKEFMDSLTPEQMEEMTNTFKNAVEGNVLKNVEKLKSLKDDLVKANIEKDEKVKISRDSYSSENWDAKDVAYARVDNLKRLVMNQENIVKSLSNFGTTATITDEDGHAYNDVPDFREVDTTEFFFDEKNVLEIETPKYIPYIDEEKFRLKGYIFDAIRLTEDSYLVSINGYERDKKYRNSFVAVTLDQLVLIIDFYTSKAKAVNIQKAEERNVRVRERYFKLSEDERKKYLFDERYYSSLPVTVKKKITKAEWDELDLEGREKLDIPVKNYRAERIKSKLKDGSMWASFHYLYEDFIDKSKTIVNRDGSPAKSRFGAYANPVVSIYWNKFVEMIDYKLIDIKIQRQDYSDTYQKGMETSFGESNVDLALKEDYGILVKRQNGDIIKPLEINLIKESWIKIQKVFGNLKENALKYNLKISHSGKKLMFAMKAIGVYIPSMGTIGVSNKLGENQFESTFSHETAHFIDNFIGELNGKRYATDNYEGLAGRIAFTFRNSMNKPKSQQTEYINSTKECFARCMQQYYGWKTYGDSATVENVTGGDDYSMSIFSNPVFAPKEKFLNDLVPLIEQFFKENLDVFETTFDVGGSNDLAPIVETVEQPKQPKQEDLTKLIYALELLGENKLAYALKLLV